MYATRQAVNEILNLSMAEKISIIEEIWDSIASGDEYPELLESQRAEG